MIKTTPTLLVVEDSRPVRLLLTQGLGRSGYRVLEAADGQKGVELFISEKPDLVLMDVNMPIMDGFDACRNIRLYEEETVTPILMLTGSDDLHSIQTAFEVGANDFITKPINLPLLEQRIRYALRDADREQALRKAKGLQDNARALAGLGFWEYNEVLGQYTWSEDASEILHWVKSLPETLEAMGQIVHPNDRKRLLAVFNDALIMGSKFDLEVRSISKQQEYLLKIVGQRDGEQKRLIGAFQDITAQRRLEQQANFLNFHDSVTGLPNRKLFQRDLEEVLTHLNHSDVHFAIVVLDVARFHQIHDAYGSEVSDQLLSLMASQLKTAMPRDAFLARLDGGSFALKMPLSSQWTEDEIHSAIESWLKVLDRSWVVADKEVFLNFIAGVSLVPRHGDDASILLRKAHRAHRGIKPSSNISLGIYKGEQEDSLQKRLMLEMALRKAIEHEEFYLVYQPQVNLNTGDVVGVEALIRWRRPSFGVVPPDQFIPVLEEMGLIQQLGDWIIQHAAKQQVAWKKSGVSLRMAINLSPVQFEQMDLPDKITRLISETGAKFSDIELEITESLAMHSPETTIRMLKRLREEGFKIAIDDFGIGFSSLEYLLRFPLDTLKIDRAFIKDITRGRSDCAIVRALTSLCQGLGLTTIAEGVETQRQRDYLDALGATEIQGYLISKPLESSELMQFIADYKQNQNYQSI